MQLDNVNVAQTLALMLAGLGAMGPRQRRWQARRCDMA
jgi:hypothetical protein